MCIIEFFITIKMISFLSSFFKTPFRNNSLRLYESSTLNLINSIIKYLKISVNPTSIGIK